MTKIIGVASNHLNHANSRFGTNYVDYIQKNYIEGITNSGLLPMVIPMGDPELAVAYMAQVDGLLLAGGQDISPKFFNEEPVPGIGETDQYRDQFEIALVKDALAQNKPILGICRGEQLINVALGGTLYQDLETQYKTLAIKHNQYPTKWEIPTHRLEWQRDNWLNDFAKRNTLVNSFHHQAVKTLAPGLTLDAISTDGVIEAYSDDARHIYAVQWHPEMLLANGAPYQLFFDLFAQKVAE